MTIEHMACIHVQLLQSHLCKQKTQIEALGCEYQGGCWMNYLAPELVLPKGIGKPAIRLHESSRCCIHGLTRDIAVPQAARCSHVLSKAHTPCIESFLSGANAGAKCVYQVMRDTDASTEPCLWMALNEELCRYLSVAHSKGITRGDQGLTDDIEGLSAESAVHVDHLIGAHRLQHIYQLAAGQPDVGELRLHVCSAECCCYSLPAGHVHV